MDGVGLVISVDTTTMFFSYIILRKSLFAIIFSYLHLIAWNSRVKNCMASRTERNFFFNYFPYSVFVGERICRSCLRSQNISNYGGSSCRPGVLGGKNCHKGHCGWLMFFADREKRLPGSTLTRSISLKMRLIGFRIRMAGTALVLVWCVCYTVHFVNCWWMFLSVVTVNLT